MSRLIKALLGTIAILIIVAVVVGAILFLIHLNDLYPDALGIGFISLFALVIIVFIFWFIYDNE